MKTAIIPCVKPKRQVDRPVPARTLYKSQFFTMALAWADSNNYSILILSAKYGLIRDMDLIMPYEEKMTRHLALLYQSKIRSQLRGVDAIHCCFSTYANALPGNVPSVFPAGMRGIGDMYAVLKANTK